MSTGRRSKALDARRQVSGPWRRPQTVAVAVLVFLSIAVGTWLILGRGYGPIGGEGYRYAMAIVRRCNLRDREGLESVQAMIDQGVESDRLSSAEAATLASIIRIGCDGRWREAELECRRLMAAQAKQARR